MSDVYELAPSMRLLITMHNMSSVDCSSAKNNDELSAVSGMSSGDLQRALDELVAYGYIVNDGGAYHLSRLGICAIRSVYT